MHSPVLQQLSRILPGGLVSAFELSLHSGSAFHCPFCGYSARDLAETGRDSPANRRYEVVGAGRRKALCYKCDSSDRERLVYLYLRDSFRLFSTAKALKVLHVAPEKNLMQRIAAVPSLKYFTGDKWNDKHAYYGDMEPLDVTDIEYVNDYFDLIICNHVLEHVPDDHRAMGELFRVLKPGGTAILQVPLSEKIKTTLEDFSLTTEEERLTAFGQEDHVRLYGRDYSTRLESVGFKVKKTDISRLPQYRLCGLNPVELLYIATKH